MKFLGARPPVPPYLHVGSVQLEASATGTLTGPTTRLIEKEWRRISGQIPEDPHRMRAIFKRLKQREADSSYTEEPYEVFYTITDGQAGPVIDFFF